MDDPIVGYHVGEDVSLWNHHLMACLKCVSDEDRRPAGAVSLTEAKRYDADGFPYICDECEEMLLDG